MSNRTLSTFWIIGLAALLVGCGSGDDDVQVSSLSASAQTRASLGVESWSVHRNLKTGQQTILGNDGDRRQLMSMRFVEESDTLSYADAAGESFVEVNHQVLRQTPAAPARMQAMANRFFADTLPPMPAAAGGSSGRLASEDFGVALPGQAELQAAQTLLDAFAQTGFAQCAQLIATIAAIAAQKLIVCAPFIGDSRLCDMYTDMLAALRRACVAGGCWPC